MSRTAAALVIGNEILTGKIQEANVTVLGKELRLLGVTLRRVVMCPDDIGVIAADLVALKETHDFVFTSGGVGPTPDDVTLPAVAAAFGVPLRRDPVMEAMIRARWGDAVTEGHLRMAEVPEGAETDATDEVPWPVVSMGNVSILPGVPDIFRVKLRLLRARIGAERPFVSRALYTTCDEGTIAQLLDDVGKAHPGVDIGSYPRFGRGKGEPDFSYRVKLTFDGLDPKEVDAALGRCREALGDQVLREE